MPTITQIKQQPRRQDRYTVYIDGGYSLSLGENDLVAAGLRAGDDISEGRVAELTNLAAVGSALDRVYRLLSYRQRSRKEVADYLWRKGYDDAVIDLALERLRTTGLIDDVTFAADWVASRQDTSPRSAVQLRAELRQKGIDTETIEDVLQGVGSDAEIEAAVAIINQKRLRQRYPEPQKLIRYLQGKGFRFSTIATALQQMEEN